jgi:hypothetical protein
LTEIQAYEVVEDLTGFQLRLYAPHTLVTKPMPGSLSQSGNQAFGYLADYIFGNNESSMKIAMTAPVLQQKTESGFEVSFVMPRDMASPPAPRTDLKISRVAGKLMAAVRFSGSASDGLFESKAEKLLQALRGSGYEPVSEVMFARYDGPWTLPLLRRNEVLVEVVSTKAP